MGEVDMSGYRMGHECTEAYPVHQHARRFFYTRFLQSNSVNVSIHRRRCPHIPSATVP